MTPARFEVHGRNSQKSPGTHTAQKGPVEDEQSLRFCKKAQAHSAQGKL